MIEKQLDFFETKTLNEFIKYLVDEYKNTL